jgi:hypothetical protein
MLTFIHKPYLTDNGEFDTKVGILKLALRSQSSFRASQVSIVSIKSATCGLMPASSLPVYPSFLSSPVSNDKRTVRAFCQTARSQARFARLQGRGKVSLGELDY